MLLYPNAKINLGLNVVQKRNDGFHDIETLFYPIAIHDILEFTPCEKTTFSSSGIEIPNNGDNLVIKAYRLLKADFSLSPLKIHLHKVIPIGAGLGGGSADAAFMLKGLRDYFKLPLSNDTLKQYAAKLGSDCAFFIDNQPSYAWGRGELMRPVNLWLKDFYLLLIYPNKHISTAQAYGQITPKKPVKNVEEVVQLPLEQWKENLTNDFETSAFSIYPELQQLKAELYDMGALYACMSGSGSSFYALFHHKQELPEKLKKHSNWWIAL